MSEQRDSGREELQNHWRVVAGSSIGMAMGLSMFNFVQSIFVTEMENEFGWTRGDIALAMAALILGSLTAPLIGLAIDRYGVRRVLFVSSIGTSLAFFGLAAITAEIWTYYLTFALLVLVGSGTTPISYARAVSTWFDKELGFALALSLSGISISAFLLPPILVAVIDEYGWRGGYAFLALLPTVIGLPIIYLWVFERERREGQEAVVQFGLTAAQALRDRRFWLMCLAISLVTVPAISLATQLQPLLTDKGFSNETAARLLSIFALSVLVGRLVIGRLCDRFWAPGVACVTLLVTSTGAFMLVGTGGSFGHCAVALGLLGIAQGAEINLFALLIARYFGTRAYSAIYGNANVCFTLSIAGGSIMFGLLYDLNGNYDMALRISGGFLILSALAFLTLGRYPRWDLEDRTTRPSLQ